MNDPDGESLDDVLDRLEALYDEKERRDGPPLGASVVTVPLQPRCPVCFQEWPRLIAGEVIECTCGLEFLLDPPVVTW